MEHEEWIRSLVEEYERPLCRYAASLTGSGSAAQDAVQETFLRLCRAQREKLEGHEAAWLFKVCRSRALDMLRKEKPMQAITPEQEARLSSTEAAPDAQAVAHDDEGLLPRLLQTLPPRQRELIRLKFQQHLSYREIARITELSESNVGYLIHVSIKALRDEMNTLQGVAP